MDLLLPVIDERGRADNEGRLRLFSRDILIVVGKKKRCGLQCFAKAHVICQNTAEAVLIEHSHPSVSDGLVFAKYVLQGRRHVVIRVGNRLELFDEFLEMAVAVCVDVLHGLHHLIEIERAEGRNVHLSGKQLLRGNLQRIHHFRQLLEFLVLLKAQEVAVLKADKLLGLPVAADSRKQLVGRQFVRGKLYAQKSVSHRDSGVHRHPAPDLQAHKLLRRPDLTPVHERSEPMVKKVVQRLLIARHQKDFFRRILLRHAAFQILHKIRLRLCVPVVLGLEPETPPAVTVKRTVADLSVEGRRRADHCLFIQVQIAHKFRLDRNVLTDQFRADLRDIRHLRELRERFPVKIRQRASSDIHFDLAINCRGAHEGFQLLGLFPADPAQGRLIFPDAQIVVVGDAAQELRQFSVQAHAVESLSVR